MTTEQKILRGELIAIYSLLGLKILSNKKLQNNIRSFAYKIVNYIKTPIYRKFYAKRYE